MNCVKSVRMKFEGLNYWSSSDFKNFTIKLVYNMNSFQYNFILVRVFLFNVYISMRFVTCPVSCGTTKLHWNI